MKTLIKENVVEFIFDKRKLIIFVIFAWFCGNELVLAKSVEMSVYEYIMLVMGNHYYIIYFLLMSYLFFLFDQIKKANNLVNIRVKRIRTKYLIRLFSALIQTVLYIGIHFIIAFCIGMTRLEVINRFQTEMISGYYNDTLSFVYGYQRYFDTPSLALIIMGLYMIVGLSLLAMIMFVVNEIKGNKYTLVVAGVMILNIILGFKLNIHGLAEVFFLNNYFILHHVLFMSGFICAVLNIIIIALLIVGMYYLLKKKIGNHYHKYNYVRFILSSTYKISITFLLIYITLNCISVYLQDKHFYLLDGVVVNLLGYSNYQLNLMELIKHILFFAIPLFFIGKFLECEIHMYNDQVKIRYKNKSEWNHIINNTIGVYTWIYAMVFIVFMTVIYLFSIFQSGASDSYFNEFISYVDISNNEFREIIMLSCVLKTLELIYYKNILVLLTNLFKNRILAYLLTLSGFIIPFIITKPVISYGRSSLYYLCEKVHLYGISKLSMILLSILIIKIFLISLIMKWRIKY
ncbi:hypothetical protein [Kandleria vitulina]|uniref:hypothetical protein n=1 Tax=Kandleria vitulina TaxID=1630 RepID=UPI0033178435